MELPAHSLPEVSVAPSSGFVADSPFWWTAQARQTYLDALPLAAAIVNRGPRGIAIIGQNDRFLRLNAGRCGRRMPGVLARSACGDRIRKVLAGLSEQECFAWRDGGAIDGRHFTVAVAPIARAGAAGPAGPCALVTLIDRTSEVQTAESLRRQVLSDPLTGLANRAGFVEGLEQRMADDGPNNYAVVLINLARFSRVNECIGTLGGDELIITVARRLMGVLRGYDLLARTGADEFAIALRIDDGPGDVLHLARRVERSLSGPCRLSDFEIKVDCAIGCALAADDDEDSERLIRHAQLALKTSKATKRIEVYQQGALNAARRRFLVETELRRALERDELSLGFQPLMSLATGRIAGFEALARWHHAELGIVPPDEFISVAEDSGLVVPLGRWAIDRALQTLADWDRAAGRILPIYVGVNVSPIQIARDDVPQIVAAALEKHSLSGNRLAIELTESAIIADPERAGRTLEALKAQDAMVAMDDFGTGFSNLASLQRLPIDSLKIDRSFVTNMLDDPDKVAIVRAVLSLAQALGMTTTAEGVETAELARTLAALGCTTAQGWFYSSALDGAEALAFAMNSLR